MDDIEFEVCKSTEKSICPKKRAKNVVNSTLTSVLDRANISKRNTTSVSSCCSIGWAIFN